MAKAKLVQLRVPEELLRRVDSFVAEGLYKSRSDVIMDATRRFLERTAPTTPLELFIDSYLRGAVKPSKGATERLDEIFKKLRANPTWRKEFGNTPHQIMRRLRSRAA